MQSFSTSNVAQGQLRTAAWAKQGAIILAASLFVALCARVTLPLPFTPVPLTLQNFGVLLVGLLLGTRRGFAALALYLAEGALGLPVFNPTGPGGIAQLLEPGVFRSQFVGVVAGRHHLPVPAVTVQVVGERGVQRKKRGTKNQAGNEDQQQPPSAELEAWTFSFRPWTLDLGP